MASTVPNTGGSNVTATLWRADNFTVGGLGWNVSSIQTYAYDTNNATPRWTEASIFIMRNTEGTPLVASASASWAYSGINRVFNGEANLGNTARQLQLLTANFNDVVLDPGEYLFGFWVNNTTAGTNNWFPYVMDINPDNAFDPITRAGNSLVSSNGGESWSVTSVGTGGWNQAPEIPFIVIGTAVPEPSTLALVLLGMVPLAAGRRWVIKKRSANSPQV